MATAVGEVRILGLDPGLAETGWGMVSVQGSSIRYLAHGHVQTPVNLELESRLHLIFVAIQEVIARYQPSRASVESLFFSKNVTSAMPVAHARGVILLACAMAQMPVQEYTPPQIKQAVLGSGRAEKSQVQEMVRLILGLTTIPKPDHAADALAAAICHANFSAFSALLSAKASPSR